MYVSDEHDIVSPGTDGHYDGAVDFDTSWRLSSAPRRRHSAYPADAKGESAARLSRAVTELTPAERQTGEPALGQHAGDDRADQPAADPVRAAEVPARRRSAAARRRRREREPRPRRGDR